MPPSLLATLPPLPAPPLASRIAEHAPPPPLPSLSPSHELELHHPTPIRGYSTPPPALHAPPPALHAPPPALHAPPSAGQPTPLVYAALYDRLVARWVVLGRDVEVWGVEARGRKRAWRGGQSEEEGAEWEEEEEERRRGKRRVGDEGKRVNEDEVITADDEGNILDDYGKRWHRRCTTCPSASPAFARPESNLRAEASPLASLPLHRSGTSPIPPSTTPPLPPRRRTSAPSSPIAEPLIQHAQRRRSHSDALVNVIKSFEVVLQYRAQGWRLISQEGQRRRSAGGE